MSPRDGARSAFTLTDGRRFTTRYFAKDDAWDVHEGPVTDLVAYRGRMVRTTQQLYRAYRGHAGGPEVRSPKDFPNQIAAIAWIAQEA